MLSLLCRCTCSSTPSTSCLLQLGTFRELSACGTPRESTTIIRALLSRALQLLAQRLLLCLAIDEAVLNMECKHCGHNFDNPPFVLDTSGVALLSSVSGFGCLPASTASLWSRGWWGGCDTRRSGSTSSCACSLAFQCALRGSLDADGWGWSSTL